MALHEARCDLVRGEVLDLKEGKGRILATSRKNGVVGYSRLELGRDHGGLHHEVATDSTGGGFDLGHHGLT